MGGESSGFTTHFADRFPAMFTCSARNSGPVCPMGERRVDYGTRRGASMRESRLFFRLDHDPNGQDYTVEAWINGAGERPAGTSWRQSVTKGELPTETDLASPDLDESGVADLGDALFGLLSGGELGEAWRQAREASVAGIVFDVRPAELQALPWEALRDDEGNLTFGTPWQPGIRAMVPYPLTPDPLPLPLHVLVVVGDPADESLKAEEELEAIYRGLHSSPCCWQIDVLLGPDQEEFREAFAEISPHVLHFVGHGTLQNHKPALEVRSRTSGRWRLTASYVANALGDSPRPRLVVLNACHTVERHTVEHRLAPPLARGVAATFLARGAGAVISTQGALPSDVGVQFAEHLYRGLATGDSVDRAVADARRKVQFGSDPQPTDWVLPVVETRADPSLILRQVNRPEPDVVLGKDKAFSEVPRLVDRSVDRRLVHRRITERQGRSELVFVIGDAEMGKSLLLRSYIVSQALNGQPVVYVSLKDRGQVSAPDFVRTVAQQAGIWLDDVDAKSLCKETEKAFTARAPALAGPMLSARPRDAAVAPTLDGYQQLKGLLVGLARPGPLILVLDDVAQIDDADAFVATVLEPAAKGDLNGIRLVIAGRRDDCRKLAGHQLTTFREIEVRAFDSKDAVMLVREYLTRTKPINPDPEKWELYRDRLIGWARTRAQDATNRLRPLELISFANSFQIQVGLL
jgi:hypothetical protein